ncbi:mechanosensitive ion channel family protein [Chitiniphilus eburneus]|uniref:Mechanosensitive ion channel family protein n=1 Tax=Chitiniphilus eburneus TaxID=2571148 RepID=A0A4U0Q003_9NEIS|nr:mechanosensitive ion channel family protein [Chitiniphilus eburneus]TJZ74266.1 mechanosensitive ion channel family protein [Chitiniphilus eburneus]
MLPAWLPNFIDKIFLRDLAASLVFIVILLVLRSLIRHGILKRDDFSPDVKRRWLINLRNVVLVVFMLGMALIWANEIETLAVSLVAIAAAIVLATKEMILCMMGAIYRTSTHAYSVGDRIEIAGLKGQVIDINLLSTTLLESSQAVARKGTVGRGITFPNSLVLSQPVFNETMLGSYVLHTVHVNINRGEDWQGGESAMLAEARAVVEEYAADLAKHARELQRGQALESAALEPRLRLSLDDRESVGLHLQLPVPLGQRARIEQRILRAFLGAVPCGPAPAPDEGTEPALPAAPDPAPTA